MVTATGFHNWAAASGPPCPELPQTPVPATVKRCPPVTACPNNVVVPAGSTRTRQLAVSATKRSPAASRATPVGWSSSLAVAASPSPLYPAEPVPGHSDRRPGRRPAPPGHAGRWPRPCTRHRARRPPRRSGRRGRPGPCRCPRRRWRRVRPAGGSPSRRSGVGRHDDDPAVAGVGDEEVAGRVERDPAGLVEHPGGDHRVHAGRRAARGGRPRPVPTPAEQMSPARATDSRRTAHIMPVAAAAGAGGRP